MFATTSVTASASRQQRRVVNSVAQPAEQRVTERSLGLDRTPTPVLVRTWWSDAEGVGINVIRHSLRSGNAVEQADAASSSPLPVS